MPRYITQSELLPPNVRAAIDHSDVVSISGQPLLHSSDSKEVLFDNCEEVIDMPFLVVEALIRHIPVVGHRHLREAFLGEYAILIGRALETGDEYIFGVREELGFRLE